MISIILFKTFTVDLAYCLVALLDVIVALKILLESANYFFKGQNFCGKCKVYVFVLFYAIVVYFFFQNYFNNCMIFSFVGIEYFFTLNNFFQIICCLNFRMFANFRTYC